MCKLTDLYRDTRRLTYEWAVDPTEEEAKVSDRRRGLLCARRFGLDSVDGGGGGCVARAVPHAHQIRQRRSTEPKPDAAHSEPRVEEGAPLPIPYAQTNIDISFRPTKINLGTVQARGAD